MPANSELMHEMLLRILDFFCFISDNKEGRLYYLIPIQQGAPYAYQHSSIRDVATIDDILNLVQYFKGQRIPLAPRALALFETAVRNTLYAYHQLYQKGEFVRLQDGSIGDIGFFLRCLEKCQQVFPAALPINWQTTKLKLMQFVLERQNADGSFRIFFDRRLQSYEKSSEAFYLPEALLGLIACDSEGQAKAQIQTAVSYCCEDRNRDRNLESDSATFYANWQFQLLYHWVQQKQQANSLEENHLQKLIAASKNSRFAQEAFNHHVATVEVACYLEGLVHARGTLQVLGRREHEEWFEKEIERSLQFLYNVQLKHLPSIRGGFVHHLHSHEARLDVAGHVCNSLLHLMD